MIKEKREASLRRLNLPGENSHARFSPDGQHLIFISQKRSSHGNAQVYMYGLFSEKERRLTYQDGENSDPSFDPSGKGFLYSSTTDEIKEDPEFIRKSLSRLKGQSPPSGKNSQPSWQNKPFEIYWSTLDGTYIRRLTESKFYDSEASFHPTGAQIVFSSVRAGNPDLYSMAKEGKNLRRLTSSPRAESEPIFSPDGKQMLWVEFSEDEKQAQLLLGGSDAQNPQPVTSAPALHWSPRWTPDGQWIVFSSNRSQIDNFDLYAIRKDGSCLQRLTYHPAQDLLPDISPDGAQISFTSDRSGTKQIYLLDFKKPESCPEDGPGVR